MQSKSKALNTVHWGKQRAEDHYRSAPTEFDYGTLNKLPEYTGTHPQVMNKLIENMEWHDKFQYKGEPSPEREQHKHERLKARILTWLEQRLEKNWGKIYLSEYRNYRLIGNK